MANALIEVFYRDLESWFDACTFYCDSCVDNFIDKWPGIYNRDEDFQKNSIQVDYFYEGSRRVQELFGKEEFIELLCVIGCPNCGEINFHNIWPYDMRFQVPDDFEKHVNDIARIAESTPFLLLKNSFAQRVYNEIEAHSLETSSSQLAKKYFRARSFEKRVYTRYDFIAAEKSYIGEGRYNHAGNQVLYLGEDELTCYRELRSPVEGVMIAEIEIPVSLKILDLNAEILEENDIIQAIVHSTLLSSPEEGEGWSKPQYVFTRYVADVAKSVGFDAIRYPSVRHEFGGFNIVVLNFEKNVQDIQVGEIRFYKPPKSIFSY